MMRPPVFATISPVKTTALMTGSLDERLAVLASLDPVVRRGVLATAPPQVLEGLPQGMQEEAATARKIEEEERQKERRRLMPRQRTRQLRAERNRANALAGSWS